MSNKDAAVVQSARTAGSYPVNDGSNPSRCTNPETEELIRLLRHFEGRLSQPDGLLKRAATQIASDQEQMETRAIQEEIYKKALEEILTADETSTLSGALAIAREALK